MLAYLLPPWAFVSSSISCNIPSTLRLDYISIKVWCVGSSNISVTLPQGPTAGSGPATVRVPQDYPHGGRHVVRIDLDP